MYRRDLANVQPHGKASQSIMVWAEEEDSSCRDDKGPKGATYQQDNARIHTARETLDWLLLHGTRAVN